MVLAFISEPNYCRRRRELEGYIVIRALSFADCARSLLLAPAGDAVHSFMRQAASRHSCECRFLVHATERELWSLSSVRKDAARECLPAHQCRLP